jgi:hypothetical protein
VITVHAEVDLIPAGGSSQKPNTLESFEFALNTANAYPYGGDDLPKIELLFGIRKTRVRTRLRVLPSRRSAMFVVPKTGTVVPYWVQLSRLRAHQRPDLLSLHHPLDIPVCIKVEDDDG